MEWKIVVVTITITGNLHIECKGFVIGLSQPVYNTLMLIENTFS